MELTKTDFEIAGCLRRLFRQKYILKNKNLKWYQSVVDHEKALSHFFEPWLLRLVINDSLGVIYLDSISVDIEDQLEYQLGRVQILTAVSTILLLFLRQKRLDYFLNPDGDDTPMVEVLHLREFASQFNQNKLDHTFERQFRRALDELSDLQVINELKQDSGLYEISPVCEVLLPADSLNELKQKITTHFQNSKNSAQNGEAFNA